MQFINLYDHILSELEFGRTETGINLLVGMLDAAELQRSAKCSARTALADHPLRAMLLEDPMLADALKTPGNPARRVNMLNTQDFDNTISSTGRRLFAATSDIAFTRALRQRHEHAERQLIRAWRKGQKIWLIIDPQYDLLSSLDGFDTSNIIINSHGDIRKSAVIDGVAGETFDLILAPHLPDQITVQAMAQLIVSVSDRISAAGAFVTSALRNGHPGTGWRRACFSWEPRCHTEAALAQMTAKGLTSQSYRDETGCVNWVEMHRA
jgi:hypothetical protein